MAKKTKVEQELANRKKVIRTAVRLKHSIAADTELNDIMDDAAKAFTKDVMKGILPPPLDLKKLLSLD